MTVIFKESNCGGNFMEHEMIINMVVDDGNSFAEHEFSSFAQMCDEIDKGVLDKKFPIQTLYYKNSRTEVAFCWNEEMLQERGYTVLDDIYNALHNNTLVVE